MSFSYHSKRLDTKVLFSWKCGHISHFFGISPEPEVGAMVHLNLICDHNVAFKRAQDGTNLLSNPREADVRAGIKITFPVISPGPEVAAMTHSHLIRCYISAFKRV